MNESAQSAASAERSKPAKGWTFAAFREWRSREHPGAAYQIAPHVWRPQRLAQFTGNPEAERRALKGGEPRLTGMAYSERDVFLVAAESELSAEHVGRLLYLADQWRHDPDYLQHRSKRVHLVILVREADRALLDFARRRRIRVVVLDASPAKDGAGGLAGMNHAAPMSR